jgi:hypothetical protein
MSHDVVQKLISLLLGIAFIGSDLCFAAIEMTFTGKSWWNPTKT